MLILWFIGIVLIFFKETNDEFGAVQDRFFIEWTHNSIKGYQDYWPDVKFDWTTYFNCGFIVMNKKHNKAVLFDLDGTLIDTAPDMIYTLKTVLDNNHTNTPISDKT